MTIFDLIKWSLEGDFWRFLGTIIILGMFFTFFLKLILIVMTMFAASKGVPIEVKKEKK